MTEPADHPPTRDVFITNAQTCSAGTGPGYATLPGMTFARPVAARNWLQASNPSERLKWDFMFQDVPPIKFGEEFGPLPRAEVIPMKEVK